MKDELGAVSCNFAKSFGTPRRNISLASGVDSCWNRFDSFSVINQSQWKKLFSDICRDGFFSYILETSMFFIRRERKFPASQQQQQRNWWANETTRRRSTSDSFKRCRRISQTKFACAFGNDRYDAFAAIMFVNNVANQRVFPLCWIDMIDRKATSSRNRSDGEHRKELYGRLCQYLDSRRICDHGQTYIYPELIHRLIRSRFPEDVRNYQTVKKVKHGQLVDVSERDKCYVQWEDFCKESCWAKLSSARSIHFRYACNDKSKRKIFLTVVS